MTERNGGRAIHVTWSGVFVVAAILGIVPAVLGAGNGAGPQSSETSPVAGPEEVNEVFLRRAAIGQQAEIALGEMAVQRAAHEAVKAFGRQMIDEHRQAQEEVHQLAAKEGISLPTRLETRRRQHQHLFAQLWGEPFDRAYMSYMLHDHVNDVHEFEQGVRKLDNPEIQQWAEGTLALLKKHLEKAEQIATTIGIREQQVR